MEEARRGMALEAERRALVAAREDGKLDAAGAARLEALPGLIREAGETFKRFIERLPELLREGGGGGLSPASWPAAQLAERQAALARMGGGATLLNTLSAEGALFIVTVTPSSVAARESPEGREDLAQLAMAFRDLVADPSKDPRPLGKRLYDAVIKPAEGDIGPPGPDASTLMLSLDGSLRYAPVAAMWDGGKWLAEKWPVSLFTPATALRLNDEPYAGEASVEGLGVTRAWPGFPALPGVAAELEAVVRTPASPAGALPGEARLDGAFDRKALSGALASDAPVVHLASHFRLDPGSHGNTALLLGDGKTLSLGEIRSGADLDFKGLDLLTLSACDTASGARSGEGKEVDSLAETVQRAGAAAVLATLMPVDDNAAPALMREFYRLRYTGGLDKARALRGAQMAAARDTGSAPAPERAALAAAGAAGAAGGERAALAAEAPPWEGGGFSHPFYWSTFVLMGDFR
jgi:CHAT domain-containing protein